MPIFKIIVTILHLSFDCHDNLPKIVIIIPIFRWETEVQRKCDPF